METIWPQTIITLFGCGELSEKSSVFKFARNRLYDKNVVRIICEFLSDKNVTTKKQKQCEKLMESFGIEDIGKVLQSENAIISGSCILYALTCDDNTKWEPNDVDLYCKKESIQNIRNYLESKNYKLDVGRTTSCCQIYNNRYSGLPKENNIYVETWTYICNCDNDVFYSSHRYMKDINRIWSKFNIQRYDPIHPIFNSNIDGRCFKCNFIAKRVQIITCTSCDYPCEIIVGKFDMPILENWWNGEWIFMMYPNDVKNKKSIVRPCTHGRFNWESRIRKYRRRGITLSNVPH